MYNYKHGLYTLCTVLSIFFYASVIIALQHETIVFPCLKGFKMDSNMIPLGFSRGL